MRKKFFTFTGTTTHSATTKMAHQHLYSFIYYALLHMLSCFIFTITRLGMYCYHCFIDKKIKAQSLIN